MKEEEIRPQKIFDEYLRLAKQDTKTYFSDAERIRGLCPACNSVGDLAFNKSGFIYEVCPKCYTLFVNPRPIVELLQGIIRSRHLRSTGHPLLQRNC